MVDRRFVNGASAFALAIALAACAHTPASSAQPNTAVAPLVEDAAAIRGRIVDPPVQLQPPPPPVRTIVTPQRGAPQRREPRGLSAIRAANSGALAPSRGDSFLNGVQVFSYEPGRIYEIYTTPLRVTVISLRPGERVVSMVAGDTVRWQIAETTSGSGADARSHVVLKPLRQGLSTNLVLTTSERVYMISLRATAQTDAFNAAVAWEYPDAFDHVDLETLLVTDGASSSRLPLDRVETRYRVTPRFGQRAPVWMPEAVFDDGAKTYIRFPAVAAHSELPPLFVIGPDGEAQLVNYRVRGLTYVVDQLFERAELRLGARRAVVVRITRTGAGS